MKNLILILAIIAIAITSCALFNGLVIDGKFGSDYNNNLALNAIVYLLITIILMVIYKKIESDNVALNDAIAIHSNKHLIEYEKARKAHVSRLIKDSERRFSEAWGNHREAQLQRRMYEDSYRANPASHCRQRLIHLYNIEGEFLKVINSEKKVLAELQSN